MAIKLIKLVAPYILGGFCLWIFLWIAGAVLAKAPPYLSIPIMVVVILFIVMSFGSPYSKKRDTEGKPK